MNRPVFAKLSSAPAAAVVVLMLSFLSACSGPISTHGDFQARRAFYDGSHMRSVWSRRVTTPLPGPVELVAMNLPVRLNPLHFSLGSSAVSEEERQAAQTRKGRMRVEVLSWPDRKPVGKAVFDEEEGFANIRLTGSGEWRDSFVMRLTELRRFYPRLELSYHYRAPLPGTVAAAVLEEESIARAKGGKIPPAGKKQ